MGATSTISGFVRTLTADGTIGEAQLQDARALRAGAKRSLLRCLVDTGALSEEDLVRRLAAYAHVGVVDVADLVADRALVRRVPYRIARLRGVLPLRLEGSGVLVAMADPTDVVAKDDLTSALGAAVTTVIAAPSEIDRAIARAYQATEVAALEVVERYGDEAGSMSSVIQVEAVGGAPPAGVAAAAAPEPPAGAAAGKAGADGAADAESVVDGDAPVVRLVDLVLRDAIKRRASDIHVEPHERSLLIRYRIDGALRDIQELPAALAPPFTSRVKIMARMNITVTRRPQDARAKLRTGGREIDLRVSTLPTLFGEKIVIRILDPKSIEVTLADLFSPEDLAAFEPLILRPQGMVLVTGPTGSGKTTTLYTALRRLEERSRNIVTLEDPVEYKLAGVNQVEIKDQVGLSFAAALRSVLRQDPNVVLVGEIRDAETAQVAVQAAITGHLVLSTLHTNDATGAIARLGDLGVDSAMLAEALNAVVAQRLVRRLCPHCSEPAVALAADVACIDPSLAGAAMRRPKGCERCDYAGFRGRVAAYEILTMLPELRALVAARAPEQEVRARARAAGVRSMFDAGVRLALAGRTTLDEVVARIARETGDEVARCRGCGGGLERDFRACPSCGRRIFGACAACKRDLRPGWRWCAWCGEKAPPERDPMADTGSGTPIGAAPGAPAAPAPPQGGAGAPPAREVLVVDDARDMRKILERMLTRAGYAVRQAESGEDALREIVRRKPDAVLLDIVMPGIDGLETCRRLRRRLETATLPIVMLTAADEVGTEAEAHDAGANDYLRKPIDPLVLVRRLSLALEGRSPVKDLG
jgi:type IV pilus assembly protein PilB